MAEATSLDCSAADGDDSDVGEGVRSGCDCEIADAAAALLGPSGNGGVYDAVLLPMTLLNEPQEIRKLSCGGKGQQAMAYRDENNYREADRDVEVSYGNERIP